jgi:hypothetical protein
MESVMVNTSKVLVDTDGGNMMYLPLDKLMAKQNTTTTAEPAYKPTYSNDSATGNNSGRNSARGSR